MIEEIKIKIGLFDRLKFRFSRFCNRVAYKIYKEALLEERTLKSIQNLKIENIDVISFESEYGYKNEEKELSVVMKYRDETLKHDFKYLKSESYILYNTFIDYLNKTISKDNEIKKVVNFGVSYAYIDSQLATMFPHVNFVGIDRSKLTQYFNEKRFNEISNLSFVAEDIFNYLKFNSGDLFICVRTLCLLPESFIIKLFKKVHEAGFKYIIIADQTGISRQTGNTFTYSLKPMSSIVYKNSMLLHNHPNLLNITGFKVVNSFMFKTNHREKDFRIVVFKGLNNNRSNLKI